MAYAKQIAVVGSLHKLHNICMILLMDQCFLQYSAFKKTISQKCMPDEYSSNV